MCLPGVFFIGQLGVLLHWRMVIKLYMGRWSTTWWRRDCCRRQRSNTTSWYKHSNFKSSTYSRSVSFVVLANFCFIPMSCIRYYQAGCNKSFLQWHIETWLHFFIMFHMATAGYFHNFIRFFWKFGRNEFGVVCTPVTRYTLLTYTCVVHTLL